MSAQTSAYASDALTDETVDVVVIGVLATGPASAHHALPFRQLSDDLVYFTRDTELDENTRDRFATRGIRVVDTAAAGALAAAHINSLLVTADTEAALNRVTAD